MTNIGVEIRIAHVSEDSNSPKMLRTPLTIHANNEIYVVELPDFEDLTHWLGDNTGKGANDSLEAVSLHGLFNLTNRRGAQLTISERAFSQAGPALRVVIDRALERQIRMPFPLASYYRGVYMGELVVEGYKRTVPWREGDMPKDAVKIGSQWLIKT